MNKLIILKYGELWLKSERTKKRFLNALKWHLENVFPKDTFIIKRDRIEVITNNHSLLRFKYVPGIEYAHICYKVPAEIEKIKKNIEEILKKESLNFNSFAVRCKRTGKHEFRSKDVEREIGAHIKNKTNSKVNLTSPEQTFRIEIIQNTAYICFNTIECIGGLPYASEGMCKVNNPDNIFLITELLKRGMYVKNMPSYLEKYYPPIKKDRITEFDVYIYDYTSEEVQKIKEITKGNTLILFPLITYSKKEVIEKDKRTKEEINNILSYHIQS